MADARGLTRTERLRARQRVRARRRVLTLGGAVGVTAVVAASAAFVAPQLQSESGAAATSTSAAAAGFTAVETQRLAPVTAATTAESSTQKVKAQQETQEPPAVPADSGDGRRVVFDEADQRVWLVGDDGEADRTYLVSGSKYDNLDPGTYAVRNRLRNATAFDYSGTMEYFVEFTSGRNAPIGFHTVPLDNDGRPEQTKAQLGTPLSAGCIRQWKPDAVALWDFAQIGTTVVVV